MVVVHTCLDWDFTLRPRHVLCSIMQSGGVTFILIACPVT